MTKISIQGCGITGMMMALSLANRNIKTRLFERSESEKFPPDVRTTTFTQSSKEFLEEIGIWEYLETESGIVKDIYIVDNKSPKMLHLDRKENDKRGFVIPNDFIKETLYNLVKNNNLIELKKGFEADPKKEDMVLICEGRSSKFLENFKNRINKSYKQAAIVLICKHELDHDNVAVEHFMPKGPFASLPMKNPKYSSIVWTEPLEMADQFKSMDRNKVEEHLQEKMGEFLGRVQIAGEIQIFPLSARITKNYYKNNMVLIGDSAHSIHPLAGQGLNQGIKDIASLTNIFAQRLKIGLNIDELALKQYEHQRSRDNYLMFQMTDNLNKIFSNQIFPLSLLRKLGLSFLDEFSSLKKLISNYGTGLGI